MKKLFYQLALLIMITFLLIQGQFILKPTVLAILLAIAINPMISWLRKKIGNHLLSFVIVFLSITAIIGLLFMLLGGQIVSLFNDLQSDQYAYERIEAQLAEFLERIGVTYSDVIDPVSKSFSSIFQSVGGMLSALITFSGSTMATLLLTVVLSYFFSAYYPGIRKVFINTLSEGAKEPIKDAMSDMPKSLRGYLRGMGIIMLILASLTSLTYWIIGVSYPLIWGLITGLLAFIPYVGSVIAAFLPFLYTVVSEGSFDKAIWIVIAFLIIQQVEGNYLTPKVLGKNVNMNPFTIIILMLIAGHVWGLLGIIIIIPVSGMMVTIMENFESTKNIAKLMSSELESKD